MYRRIFCGFMFLLFFTGCSTSVEQPKEIIRGEMNCTVEDSSFTLMLENGQIVKYIDSVDGELPQETVDILNEEYLVGVTDNDEAIRLMDEGLSDLEGHCE